MLLSRPCGRLEFRSGHDNSSTGQTVHCRSEADYRQHRLALRLVVGPYASMAREPLCRHDPRLPDAHAEESETRLAIGDGQRTASAVSVKARQQWPGLVDEFWQRVKEGRIEVVNAYSNPRLSEVYPELFVHSLVLGKEYFRRHVPGIRQEVFEVPDLMCGTSQVPQILTLADYRYFMFTRPVSQQAVFWRKGLDGSRMLCCKDVYGYPELQGKPGAAFPGINPLPIWRYAIGCDDMPPTQAMVDDGLSGDPNKKTLSTMLRFFQECEKAPIRSPS